MRVAYHLEWPARTNRRSGYGHSRRHAYLRGTGLRSIRRSALRLHQIEVHGLEVALQQVVEARVAVGPARSVREASSPGGSGGEVGVERFAFGASIRSRSGSCTASRPTFILKVERATSTDRGARGAPPALSRRGRTRRARGGCRGPIMPQDFTRLPSISGPASVRRRRFGRSRGCRESRPVKNEISARTASSIRHLTPPSHLRREHLTSASACERVMRGREYPDVPEEAQAATRRWAALGKAADPSFEGPLRAVRRTGRRASASSWRRSRRSPIRIAR